MLELTPRLKTIGESIERCNVVADIGSDHAYLPIYLIKNNKANKVIASDINIGPAKISKERIKKYGLENYIEVRIGNGLKVIDKYEADIIVIAGMGGLLIKSIIEERMDVAISDDRLILQPMRDSRALISWLLKSSFVIIDGEVIKENEKYYEIIRTCFDEEADRDAEVINEVYYYKNTPVLHEYIDRKIEQYMNIINQLKASNVADSDARMRECIEELNNYREAKKWLILNAEQ